VDILRKEFRLVRGVNVLGFQSHHYLSGYDDKGRPLSLTPATGFQQVAPF
jgi:hypothetical protein